jgi:succinyl-CoA synthetase beta subunit
MSVMLDRGQSKNIIVYSTEGGMDIEHVAEHTPHLIHKKLLIQSKVVVSKLVKSLST